MAQPRFVPVAVSEKTYAVLSSEDAERLAKDNAFLEASHKNYEPLTVPSGLTLPDPSMPGKRVRLLAHYCERSPFFIKKMPHDKLGNYDAITAGLKKAGLLVEQAVVKTPDFAKVREAMARRGVRLEPDSGVESKPSELLLLVPASGRSLFSFMVSREFDKEKMLAYFEALGTMHGTGMAHNHPHLGNFFEKDGVVGVHDYSLATFHNVNWKDPENILAAFENDYDHAIQVWVRAATDPHNKTMLHELQNKWVFEYYGALTRNLPASPRVKRELANMLHKLVYERHVPFLREHGYFLHKGVEF